LASASQRSGVPRRGVEPRLAVS